jgi:hypothetical protein
MAAMSEPGAVGDLVTAVADALRGDRSGLNQIVDDAKERVRERLLDALMPAPTEREPAVPIPTPKARPMPRLSRERDVEIRLRNGRRIRARIAPEVARGRDLAAVARATADNTRLAFDALGRHRKAITGLSQSQEELARKVTALEQRHDFELVGLLQGLSTLERRIRGARSVTQAVTAGARPPEPGRPALLLPRQPLKQMPDVKLLELRSQIQNVTNVVNTVQAAAFGERGSILATNNLLLAGNQLFWSLLDPVLQRFGVLNAASATVVAAMAPIGTLFTGEILLGDRQHVRFISGVATVSTSGDVFSESLRGRVAEGLWQAFRDRTDVPITVVSTDPATVFVAGVIARVSQGSVEIAAFPLVARGEVVEPPISVPVAWTVDTGAGDA